MLLKLYWPRLTTRYTERKNTLGKNQLGTRPNKGSNDACIINELNNITHHDTYKAK